MRRPVQIDVVPERKPAAGGALPFSYTTTVTPDTITREVITEWMRQASTSSTSLIMSNVSQLTERIRVLEETVGELQDILEERASSVYNAELYDLGSPGFRLRRPILVTIEEWPEEVVASLPNYDLYASASSDALALSKLKEEILTTYEELRELGEDQLGSLALEWYQSMQTLVVRADA